MWFFRRFLMTSMLEKLRVFGVHGVHAGFINRLHGYYALCWLEKGWGGKNHIDLFEEKKR